MALQFDDIVRPEAPSAGTCTRLASPALHLLASFVPG